jgi:acyl-CoA dehydrogenase
MTGIAATADPAREVTLIRDNDMNLRREVRQFLASELALRSFRPQCDSWMVGHSPTFSQKLGSRGWVGMTIPVRYGGAGRSSAERYAVIEELLAAGAPVAAHWFADRQIAPALLRHGTAAQQETFLPGICRGEIYFAIGMSEPDSGSDLAAVRTRAERDATGWRLTGSKVWTSHAHCAHYALVLARTDSVTDGNRHLGLSQFLVDLTLPGIEVRPIVTLDGAQHFNEVFFDDVALDDDALLGSRGEGWRQVMQELALERSGPERFLSTMPLLRSFLRCPGSGDPGLGILLAEASSIRAMSLAVAESLGRGEVPTVESAVVKDLGTLFERKVIDVVRAGTATRPALDSSNELERLLGEAIVHSPDRTLRGGANEVLRGIVAKALAHHER